MESGGLNPINGVSRISRISRRQPSLYHHQIRQLCIFSDPLTVILIGLAVANRGFRTIKQRTVKRWGMHT